MLHDILRHDHIQRHPPLIRYILYLNISWPCYWSGPFYRLWPYYQNQAGFQWTFATGAASQQKTLISPGTWSYTIFLEQRTQTVGTICESCPTLLSYLRRQVSIPRKLWMLGGAYSPWIWTYFKIGLAQPSRANTRTTIYVWYNWAASHKNAIQ